VKRDSVLVIGVYLLDKPTNILNIISKLDHNGNWNVFQKWVALGKGDVPLQAKNATVLTRSAPVPKFLLLNELLQSETLDQYACLLVVDDDVALPCGFIDHYLSLTQQFDFALAQPARTHASYIDHHFTEQLPGLKGRQTRFVEIGPVFSIRRDLFDVLLPFDAHSPMGWGYDFVWPCLVERNKKRMGIIDAVPIEHRMRKPVQYYDYDIANKQMYDYLSQQPHLTRGEAFRILESYTSTRHR
jgi:hypothetical protein